MFEKVKNLVAEHEEAIPPEQITESTNFYMDLGWTSMDMMGCVIDLEDILGREIPDDALNSIQTVGDLVSVLERC